MTSRKMKNEKLVAELLNRFVDMLIVSHGLKTREVEEAFRSVPRHLFVDRFHYIPKKPPKKPPKKMRFVEIGSNGPTVAQLKRIYNDEALLSHYNPPSSTSQPSLVAQMLEELQVKPGMKILEIGAGTGWNAALMGHLTGSKGRVYSIDIQADVARRARRHNRKLGSQNVTIITGDGGNGYSKAAPYDRIITTVCCPDISPHWIEQLKENGIFLITLSEVPGDGRCFLIRLQKQKNHLKGEVVGLPGFMMLRGKYGLEIDNPAEAFRKRLEEIKAGRKPIRKSAPWASWQIMKQELIRHLLFFAYVEGMSVEPIGPQFILSLKDSESICITDDKNIEIYGGNESYQTLEAINRKWIGMGAPRRDSYLVEVWPKQVEKQRPKNGWLVQREHSQLIFRLKKE